ncbi:ketoacyl-ACP synthase III [Gammaproteobacteria bacterium]|nr:ketoacyl-ACP synthase III [Gammaproteobacteria bacterium]
MSEHSRILSTGSYLPARILYNEELVQRLDTTDEWIVARTGIRQRHIASDTQKTADLAEAAARDAIAKAGIDAATIDLIIVATSTADHAFPSVATSLHRRLNIPVCPAFDVQAACSGFVYAYDVAHRFIVTGGAKRALIIGAEVFSRILDWDDRATCVLFGDGAGALILDASDEVGTLTTRLHADGRFHDLLYTDGGIGDVDKDKPVHVKMKGSEVFRVAVAELGDLVVETINAAGLSRDELDWLVPHQANIRIIQAAAKRLKLPMEQVVVTVDRHANTSAASIPLALDDAVSSGQIQRGQTLLMEAFGGGFTWGSALVRF